MTSLRDVLGAKDLYEVNAVGDAIGLVHVAATEAAAHPHNPVLQLRLHRTVAVARVRGVDHGTIIDTINIARGEEPHGASAHD